MAYIILFNDGTEEKRDFADTLSEYNYLACYNAGNKDLLYIPLTSIKKWYPVE
jgi:hypothetical protein